MNAFAVLVAAVALIPQPKSLVETGGDTTNRTVVYSVDTAIPAEGYRLEISPDGVSIASSDAAGAFYAERTLAQFGDGALPCCRIEDAPMYRWRGYLIDEGRHFFGKGEMKRLIDVMADYKYNVFHWHLTEDQGWRLAMDKWPRLAEVGSVRRSSPPPGEEKGYDNEQYGPYFYTKDEIKDIVAYARERHIEVVPEIDFPGHVLSALAAYPELSCTGGPFETGTQWGVSEDILCAGNDRTIEFLKDVMDEVCEMFPSRVIHLGGDEAPRVRWNNCSKCLARVKALGLKDTNALQGWMFREIQRHLESKGRRAMGWEVKYGDAELGLGVDAALGDTKLPKDALVHSWRSVEAGVDLVTNGYDVVMSPYMETYYTLPIGLGERDPFPYRQWTKGKKLDLMTCYMFSPMADVPEAFRGKVLGGEACAWTESTHNRAELEWKMFPRALAHAETLWADPPRRDFADFARRAGVHRLRLLARGINCSPLGLQGAVCGEATQPFPEFAKPRAVTSGPHDHFLANYFAINAWSPDNRYILALETDIKDKMPDGAPCTVGLVDTEDGNKFIPVMETRTWNFQEAAMAHWLPNEKDTFVVNDLRDGKFVAVVRNWRTGAERIIPHPVSAVSEDGSWALSINYARLYLTRPDYGYAGEGQDPRKGVVFPEDDGLWRVDLKTGEAKLLVSCAAVRDMVPEVKSPDGMSYICHTVISKDMKRVYFLSRSVEKSFEGVKKFGGVCWHTTAFTCNADGTGIRRCFPDGWGSSHFNWKPALSERDARTMIVTCNWQNKVYTHVEFTVGEEEKAHQVGGDEMNFDGHCIYTPDGNFVSGDGYWDDKFYRHWKMVRLADNAIKDIGDFYVPEKYRDIYCRCDLHPRWRADGRQLAFNSVHEGSRQIYIMDVVNDVPAKRSASSFQGLAGLYCARGIW